MKDRLDLPATHEDHRRLGDPVATRRPSARRLEIHDGVFQRVEISLVSRDCHRISPAAMRGICHGDFPFSRLPLTAHGDLSCEIIHKRRYAFESEAHR
jgi:hypothetical protein